MEFGRFGFARSRSLLAFSLVLVCSLEFKGWAQQAPASPPVENTVPHCLRRNRSLKLRWEARPSNSDSAKPAPGRRASQLGCRRQ